MLARIAFNPNEKSIRNCHRDLLLLEGKSGMDPLLGGLAGEAKGALERGDTRARTE